MSVLRRTSTSPSIASASCCLALTSESSVSGDGVPVLGTARRRSGLELDGRPTPTARATSTSMSASIGGTRASGCSTVDLLPQLDEGQLAACDLLGQPASLLRVLDLHQLVGVGQAVFAQGHQFADLRRCPGQSQAVLQVALVLAELLGQLADAVAVFVDHPVVHGRFIERCQVFALQVLDDRDLKGRVVVDVFDQCRDRRGGPARRDARQRRSPATI